MPGVLDVKSLSSSQKPAVSAQQQAASPTSSEKENFNRDMKELFIRMDKDESGHLELPEVILFLKALCDNLSEENITKIFHNLDEDKSESIDFQEFMKLFNEISVVGYKPVDNTKRKEVKEDEVKVLFNLIDTDKDGFLSEEVRYGSIKA